MRASRAASHISLRWATSRMSSAGAPYLRDSSSGTSSSLTAASTASGPATAREVSSHSTVVCASVRRCERVIGLENLTLTSEPSRRSGAGRPDAGAGWNAASSGSWFASCSR